MSATPRRVGVRRLLLVGLAVSLLLAGVVSYYASGHPDGLERAAGALGFDTAARDSATAGSPLASYEVSGMGDGPLSGGLAGVVGVLVVGMLMAALVRVLRRRPSRERR